MARKPSINTSPVAGRYAGPGERIIEYSSPSGGGGLISFRVIAGQDGAERLAVDLYRHDANVDIRVGLAEGATAPAPFAPPVTLNGYPVVGFLPLVRATRDGAPGKYRDPRIVPGEWLVTCERTDEDLAGRPDRWCTGQAFVSPDGNTVKWEQGNYDMTLTEALADMADRARVALLLTASAK